MNLHRIGFCAALLMAVLSQPIHAQEVVSNNVPADGLEIRGSVVEPSYDAGGTATTGIAGVHVALTEFRLVDNKVTPILFATMSTNSKGEFRFRPQRLGEYLIEITIEGYLPARGTWASLATGTINETIANVTMSRDKPIVEIRFGLTRRAGLSGRVLDESGNPVPGLRITIGGGFQAITSDTTTHQDGAFVASELRPGAYTVGTMPKSVIPEIVDPFTARDASLVDGDFEKTYWPGVADEGAAIPWIAPPGGTLNLPDLHVRKVATYRARVSAQSEACAEAEKWTLQVVRIEQTSDLRETTSTNSSIPVPCGKDFLIRNLRQGSYWFALWSGRRERVDAWALERVEIKDENVAVSLDLSKGETINGRFVAAKGAKLPPLNSLSISVASLMSGLPTGNDTVVPDESGRFGLNNVPWLKARIVPSTGRTGAYYVQEIRYNGQPIPDGVFSITPGGTGSVEIVIDDKPARLDVSVLDGDKPYPQAMAVIVKWPMEANGYRLPISGLWDSTPGKPLIQIGGLGPGEYRAFAFRVEDLPRVLTQTVLERLASRGEKVVLERGASQNITLKLADLTR